MESLAGDQVTLQIELVGNEAMGVKKTLHLA